MDILIITLLILIQLELIAYALLKRVTLIQSVKKSVLLDTSVLIDGRIAYAVKTGFMPRNLIIPKSVINELQLLADGSDSEKRSRARHGLDVAKDLQVESSVNVRILDDPGSTDGVDAHLIRLAKKHGHSICTIDYNLAKVAEVESIVVLNINDLARQLKMNYLPGEKVSIDIIQKGNDSQQGVGYLADGTMVVVDKAQKDIGKQVEIEFVRSLQTAAGRMLFAKKMNHPITRDSTHSANGMGRKKRIVKSPEDSLVELANN